MVEVVIDGRFTATGYIDARQQRGDVWEAYVDYSYRAENGFPSHRRDWLPVDEFTVPTIDDVPQGDQVVPPRPNPS
jgi:hypothetical protein